MELSRSAALIETHHALLKRLLPGDDVAGLPVREGQFHYVVIGSSAVVCFARTAAAAARLPERAAVLRGIGGLDLGVAVPEPLDSGAVGGGSYLVLTRIPGAPLDPGAFDRPGVTETIARQCHTLTSRLAAAGPDAAIRGLLPTASAERWAEFAERVRAELYPLMNAHGWSRAARELAALDGLPPLTTAVVHGDLGAENLLWEEDADGPVLRGVVDWDGVCLGDRAEDLAALGAGYGPGLLRRVLDLNGGDSALSTRIAIIQGTFALQQALYAYHDGDDAELADGLAGYH
jgi:aminoglycoside phosphotransferase